VANGADGVEETHNVNRAAVLDSPGKALKSRLERIQPQIHREGGVRLKSNNSHGYMPAAGVHHSIFAAS